MSKQHDKAFFVSFMGVLGLLVLFTVAIIFAARALEGDKALTPQQIAKIEERIKPAGQVNTDANASLPSAPAGDTGGAAKAPLTGEQVTAQVCGACHGGALPNAPKIGDKSAWSSRGSLAQLTASAIKGKGAMPPRGGMPSLSDAEIEAAIKHMSGL
ncbi:MAG TPA: c-type cytochrome [Nevskiales bacterium]|nr:c-type cytochrome [Nevskiales bacterium]